MTPHEKLPLSVQAIIAYRDALQKENMSQFKVGTNHGKYFLEKFKALYSKIDPQPNAIMTEYCSSFKHFDKSQEAIYNQPKDAVIQLPVLLSTAKQEINSVQSLINTLREMRRSRLSSRFKRNRKKV